MFRKVISLVRGGYNRAFLMVAAVACAVMSPGLLMAAEGDPIDVVVPAVNFNLTGLASKITDQLFPVIAMVGGVAIAILIAWAIFRFANRSVKG